MGKVIGFPRLHARAPSVTAKLARRSKVTPAFRATAVDKTRGHHFEGIVSLPHHLITAQLLAPTSEAMASRELQSSMTDRNDLSCESPMHGNLGQIVPIVKDTMSHDCDLAVGHNVLMGEIRDEEMAESAWQDEFRARLKHIQGDRTQDDMADLLRVSRDTYNKWVNRGSKVPIRLLPKIAKIGAVSLEWLIEGPRTTAAKKPPKAKKPAAKVASSR